MPDKGGTVRALLAGPIAAVLYVASGKLALLLALPPGYASAIFPPAGIAVAVAFILGRRALPWVFLGSLALNLWVALDAAPSPALAGLLAALTIAAASTLQAGLGGALLRRWIGYPTRLDRGREICLLLASAPLVCLTSATLSVSALAGLHVFAARAFAVNWLAWWIGDTLGVIVCVPLVLIFAGAPRADWRRKLVAVGGPLLLSFGLCVLAFRQAAAWEQELSLRDFRLQATQAADAIQGRLAEQEALVTQVAAFMAHGGERLVERAEFEAYVDEFIARYPMILAVEWAPHVAGARRNAFEASQRRQLPGFEIRDHTGPDDKLAPVAARPDYYPLTYIVPRKGSTVALGFDLASTADRRAAIAAALASGQPTASAPLHLLQEQGTQEAILLLQRVASGPAAGSVVLTVLKAEEFVRRALPAQHADIELRIRDVAADKAIFGDGRSAAPGAPTLASTLTYGTRAYRLEITPGAAYLAGHRSWQSFALLAAGLFGTGLLGALLLLGTGYAARIERTVAEQTGVLARASERIRLLLHNAGDGIHILDARGNVVEASEAFCEMLGYPRSAVIGMNVRQWDPATDRPDMDARLLEFFQSTAVRKFEARHRACDGRIFDVELTVRSVEFGGERLLFCSARDISARKNAERLLRISETRFRQIFVNAPIGKLLSPLDRSRILDANPKFCDFLGYTLEEARHLSVTDISHPDDMPRSTEALQKLLAGTASTVSFERRYRRKDGSYVWGQATATIVPGADGAESYLIVQVEDIQKRKSAEADLEEARERLAMALEASGMSIFDYDIETGIVMLDEHWAALMGSVPGASFVTVEELLAATHPEDIASTRRAAIDTLKGTTAEYAVESRVRTVSGEWKWIRSMGRVVARDAEGRATRLVGTNMDVTARRSAEERIRTMAFFDALTDLPNRALFLDRLQHALAVAHREVRPMSLLYLDLNRFKEINDTQGHHVGDSVLRAVAQRFAKVVRDSDTLARLGGDEFALVAPNTGPTDARRLAERITTSLATNISVARLDLNVGVSIGVATFPMDGTTAEELMQRADLDMYRAKSGDASRPA